MIRTTEGLKYKHETCSTEWLVVRVTNIITWNSAYVSLQNYCRDRACKHHHCMKYRVSQVQYKLTPYFLSIRKPKHMVLTVKNMELTEQNIAWFRKKMRSFYKVLSRSRVKFFGVAVLELKPSDAGDGLYHVHAHLVTNLAPHHLEVTRIWSRIIGYHCDTNTEYGPGHTATAKQWAGWRRHLHNYFAKRAAFAGIGLPAEDYLRHVVRTRLFNSFGKFPYNLEEWQLSETRRIAEFKRTHVVLLVARLTKARSETIPPPTERLEQIWLESC